MTGKAKFGGKGFPLQGKRLGMKAMGRWLGEGKCGKRGYSAGEEKEVAGEARRSFSEAFGKAVKRRASTVKKATVGEANFE